MLPLKAEINPYTMNKVKEAPLMVQKLKELNIPMGTARMIPGFRNSAEILGYQRGGKTFIFDISGNPHDGSYFCKIFSFTREGKVGFEKRFIKSARDLAGLFSPEAPNLTPQQ